MTAAVPLVLAGRRGKVPSMARVRCLALLLALAAVAGCGGERPQDVDDSQPGEFRARCGAVFVDPETGEDLPDQTYSPCPEDE